ncbi:MAG: histone deacetylase family protein [Bacteroidetes bacterium]|nr:histone deacetylase family protein [Bacteroidota bacterium]
MHPENRKRLEALKGLEDTQVESGEQYLELIHEKDYIQKVKRSCERSAHLDQDTITSPRSYEAAIHAVGATVMASESNDFAIVRPPGHHAYPSRASGFCIFNNVAIATQKLVEEGKRVLIFDFDGHLGDGTSEIFYSTDKVMYWSIHQYPAFPGHGNIDEIGMGKGKGFTVNIPLPPGCGDDVFMDAVRTFMPVAEQFQPDAVAISAGFDAHQYDLLLSLRVTANSYYKIGKLLSEKFDNLFATLEGGYNVEELPLCIDNFVAGINGKDMPHKERETDTMLQKWDEYDLRTQSLIKNLSKYWKF